ncbi:hypothetical protein A2911_01125 [Candidatus Nomurabacteria bacterium RIFCSPLOWO2_01_FULL_40_15]|uniref:Uncharacterized protein n=1 Tax=Candidatus Nomurabacteria bacterium RIFCSPLOWO2_01_FULL_40_15 TaxID=1801772 RepID=A0A1F6X5B1_9BACT|nr:MAG: hypothetical protein A2911_01125 [Candidatus Nomurabacteria bacterium RIFCSPLOWO2_01_FULL_40_15]
MRFLAWLGFVGMVVFTAKVVAIATTVIEGEGWSYFILWVAITWFGVFYVVALIWLKFRKRPEDVGRPLSHERQVP